ELQDTLRGRPTGRPSRLVVGIADVVPKLAALRILAPVLDSDVRLVCYEDRPDRLLDRLSAHGGDVVLADAPLGASHPRRAYNHRAGGCQVAFSAPPGPPRPAARRFPLSLAELPFVLPTPDAALRRALDAWFDERGIVPNVVAELDDSALVVELGSHGAGLFA